MDNMVKITTKRAVLGIITGKGQKILRGPFTAMVNCGFCRESLELRKDFA